MTEPEQIHDIDDVFGVNRQVPKTYVERKDVDIRFIESLSRSKHIVVYGGSKQGKTSLRKHSLGKDQYVVVQCSGTATARDIYATILKEAGATVDVLNTKTLSGRRQLGVKFAAKISAAFVGSVQTTASADESKETTEQTQSKYLEIDPADPNDVIRILNEMAFERFVVIEDYHYLTVEVQKQIALDLKAFHEKSNICFIVVGVWLHQNRLVLYNGDLTNRVIPIDADMWTGNELYSVMRNGEALLNVRFSEGTQTAVISGCQGNVGLLQEICHTICDRWDIKKTQSETCEIGSVSQVETVIDEIAKAQSGRYRNSISDFATGFQTSQNELYKWIIAVVICSSPDELRGGLRQVEIFNRICVNHPHKDTLQMANLVQSLGRVSQLQQSKGIQPVILDFNQNENRLKVVDSGFLLFVERRKTKDLLEVIKMTTTGD